MNLREQMALDSRNCLHRSDEFAETLTWSGGTVQCHFSRQWLAVDGEYSETSTVAPTALIYQPDAPNLGVGDVVTINSADYTVRDTQPDTGETGEVLLVLST